MSSPTAEDAIKRASSFPFQTSGSVALDSLLRGGYRAGRLTELFGRSNSGKSQLAMQACLLAAKKGVRSLYIDTEGSFRPERLEGMADARKWELEGLLEKIVYIRCDSAPEQMEAARKMATRPATSSCSLVIVDTLTRNFSVELPGRSNLSSRQAALDIHLSEMARDAYLNARAYVLTNRVTFGATQDVGIGGKTVEQLVDNSVLLERQGERVKATLLPSQESVMLAIGPSGVE